MPRSKAADCLPSSSLRLRVGYELDKYASSLVDWPPAATERRRSPDSAFIFATERGGPFTPDAVNRLVKRIGERAGFAFPVHVHMLRHACGYALANAGHDTRRIQDWLGHRSIQHTTRNTQLSAAPFKDFWR
jgi:type 1 fimbriae regulatory protein FimE